jgi:hypothetical protein
MEVIMVTLSIGQKFSTMLSIATYGVLIGLGHTTGSQVPHRALFMIGNGAYYALTAQESSCTPPVKDSFDTPKEFVTNFMPDSIICDIARAFHEKEANLFMTYKTWASWVHLQERIKEIFASFNIHKPLEQIFATGETKIASSFKKQLAHDLIVKSVYDKMAKKDTAFQNMRQPLLYFGPSPDTVTQTTAQERFEYVQQNAGILDQRFSELFYLLYVYNPKEWHVYDTNVGLLYFTPRNISAQPISTASFTPLNSADILSPTYIQNEIFTTDHIWTEQLYSLFSPTISAWNLYVSGHGSEPIIEGGQPKEEGLYTNKTESFQAFAWIAGMRSSHFTPFVRYAHNCLPTRTLFLNSCYAPADRLHRLAGKETALNYTIVSPVSTFEPVSNYVPCMQTMTYIPAWLSQTGTTVIKNKLYASDQQRSDDLAVASKFNAIFEHKDHQAMRKTIDNFFRAKPFQTPTMVVAGNMHVEKIAA